MRATSFLLIALLFLNSCGDPNRVPNSILPQPKMQAVLWDMVRADLFMNDYWFRKDSSLDRKMETSKLYQQVFNLHQVTKEQFQRSFNYYRAHPALLKAVLDSISAKASKATAAKVHPNPTRDTSHPSIRPIPFGEDSAALHERPHKVVPKKARK